MRINCKFILTVILVLISVNGFGQQNEDWSHELGINLLQIHTSTMDLSYEVANNPRYSMIISSGFTINAANNFDLLGFFLSPHSKCGNDGYSMQKQSGGFVRIGIKYNLRSNMEKRNYFFIGASLTNSLIYEKAEYSIWDPNINPVQNLSHNAYIIGASGSAGYNFKISNKLSSEFGLQISVPSNKIKDLYGISHYIPGMGFIETCDSKRSIFPIFFLNLKYKLK